MSEAGGGSGVELCDATAHAGDDRTQLQVKCSQRPGRGVSRLRISLRVRSIALREIRFLQDIE